MVRLWWIFGSGLEKNDLQIMKICWQESSRFPWGIKFIKGTCDRIKQPLFFFQRWDNKTMPQQQVSRHPRLWHECSQQGCRGNLCSLFVCWKRFDHRRIYLILIVCVTLPHRSTWHTVGKGKYVGHWMGNTNVSLHHKAALSASVLTSM